MKLYGLRFRLHQALWAIWRVFRPRPELDWVEDQPGLAEELKDMIKEELQKTKNLTNEQ